MRTRLIALIGVALIGVGCNTQGSGAGGGLAGAIEIDGSSTVFPITEAIAEEFRAEASDVDVRVGQSGTGGGFEKFCDGDTDISDASRPIEDDEKDACADNSIAFTELTVAIDGLSVVVNEGNDFVDCLTVDELKKIWEPDSEVSSWKDVRDSFPDEEIKLYGPGADSGTFDYFTDVVVGEEGASRTDYTASEDDNVLVQGIAGDSNSLGYFGYAYYVENKTKIKAIGVDNGDGCVEPSTEAIETGDYAPLSRPLFIYVSNASAQEEHVSAFVEFYLDVVSELVTEVGYVEVPADDLEQAKDAFAEISAAPEGAG